MSRSGIGNFVGRALEAAVKFTYGLNVVAVIWTFLLVFFVTADVMGRFIFNHPITGIPEIIQASLVGLAFLILASHYLGGPAGTFGSGQVAVGGLISTASWGLSHRCLGWLSSVSSFLPTGMT